MSGRFWIEVGMAAAAALGVSAWGIRSTAPAVLPVPDSGLYAEMAAVHLEEGPDVSELSKEEHAWRLSKAEDPLWSCGGWAGPTPFQRAVLSDAVPPQRNVEGGAPTEPAVYADAGGL